ncbi:hypothetical protein BDV32DRAFT_127340 [Aspergillus pseudonomiae]|uniref:Uncharacterized protein n=1 Tax=Aspergillus pseudonomiae TaxID=1506151 RepID=A0A5N7DS25_9EURO|nr:uncharacterized protein BDV37DRAFT_238430 [Aspergillus pseudonomiae]KAB8257552.1 hypothetical protein BDV32DRAFT_127340 [Aspergillus pseudonomiae]KAE8408819.1 hypothetical protein BDV37DRAFT_238430 [Aspergillus pseudonomiae]
MDAADKNDSTEYLPQLLQQKRSISVYEVPRNLTPSSEDLKNYDWGHLQEHYANAMEKHGRAEEDLRAQISKLLEVFMAWSQTTVIRDEARALKRFKTQMQHVQNSEEDLEKKRKHYVDVVKAFESALALLNDRVRP